MSNYRFPHSKTYVDRKSTTARISLNRQRTSRRNFVRFYPNAQFYVIALCGKLEMELTQLGDVRMSKAFRQGFESQRTGA